MYNTKMMQNNHHRDGTGRHRLQQQQQDQRRSMNERRHELTQRIRKKKKSSLLAQRRQNLLEKLEQQHLQDHQQMDDSTMAATASSPTTAGNNSPVLHWREALMKYLDNPLDVNCLAALYKSLLGSTNSSAGNSSDCMITSEKTALSTVDNINQLLIQVAAVSQQQSAQSQSQNLGTRFIQTLASSLKQALPQNSVNNTNQHQAAQVLVYVVQILLYLLSLPKIQHNVAVSMSYYGHQSEGWIDFILSNQPSMFLDCIGIIHNSNQRQQQQQQQPPEQYKLDEQTCWLLGTVAQDSQRLRNHLRSTNQIISVLVTYLSQYMDIMKQQQQSSLSLLPSSSTTSSSTASTAASAAASWALANMLRDDTITLGYEFCGSTKITPIFLYRLLTQTPIETSIEAAWIISSLTTRDDDTINYLFLQKQPTTPLPEHQSENYHNDSNMKNSNEVVKNNNNNNKITEINQNKQLLFNSLLNKLYETIHCYQAPQGTVNLSANSSHLILLLEPLLRSIGNVAMASQGIFVQNLLSDNRLMQCLSTLFNIGATNQNTTANTNGFSTNTTTTTSAAGIVDLSLVIWVTGCFLCDAGIPNHLSTTQAAPILLPMIVKVLTSNGSKLEWKREAVSALWNAVSDPPPFGKQQDADQQQFQDKISTLPLLEIILQDYKPVILSLKDLLLCKGDMDAILGSMRVLDKLVRNMPSCRMYFEEIRGNDTLEDICDKYGTSVSSPSAEEVSELAANLIDDYFSMDDDDYYDCGVDFPPPRSIAPQTTNDAFVFGVPAAPSPSQLHHQKVNHHHLPSIGRGRGRTLPAWMNA